MLFRILLGLACVGLITNSAYCQNFGNGQILRAIASGINQGQGNQGYQPYQQQRPTYQQQTYQQPQYQQQQYQQPQYQQPQYQQPQHQQQSTLMQGVQQYVLQRDLQQQQAAADIASKFKNTGELSSQDASKLIRQGVSPEQIMQMHRDTKDIRMNAKLKQFHKENPHIKAEQEAQKRLREANNARERNEYLNRQRQAAAQRQAAEAQRQAQAQIQAFKEYNSPANGFKRAFGNLGSDIKRGVGNSFQAPWKAVGRGVGNGIIRNLPEAPTSELK